MPKSHLIVDIFPLTCSMLNAIWTSVRPLKRSAGSGVVEIMYRRHNRRIYFLVDIFMCPLKKAVDVV